MLPSSAADTSLHRRHHQCTHLVRLYPLLSNSEEPASRNEPVSAAFLEHWLKHSAVQLDSLLLGLRLRVAIGLAVKRYLQWSIIGNLFLSAAGALVSRLQEVASSVSKGPLQYDFEVLLADWAWLANPSIISLLRAARPCLNRKAELVDPVMPYSCSSDPSACPPTSSGYTSNNITSRHIKSPADWPGLVSGERLDGWSSRTVSGGQLLEQLRSELRQTTTAYCLEARHRFFIILIYYFIFYILILSTKGKVKLRDNYSFGATN
ncbi:unnamed protein product [Protopolystoma xenopodis]|uniref:Uncharacterized protein n=1 Tax=Protopolystoma xenopodis TaxID=117903 RepID=A0A448XLY1_9PLAT|nr:unnamed protein product [Protopolystoma xenopodis]